MITVMGAAGNVGSKIADLLLQGNETIRVLEHNRSLDALAERGAEVVRGDALNVEDCGCCSGAPTRPLSFYPTTWAIPTS